jgi:CRP/FNR family transcriptional regulator
MFQRVSRAADNRPISAREDGFASIEALGSDLTIGRDRPIFWEGDPATHCFKVLSGAVRICRLMSDGRRHVTDFFLPGDMINFDLAGLYSFTAEAIVDSTVRRYPNQAIDRLVADTPRAACQMLALASDRLLSAQRQMVVLGRKNATERLASFLVTRFGRQDGETTGTLTLPMSRADIADHLGLTVETVSRIFTKLKREEIIDLPSAQCVVIRDWQMLAERCEGEEP